MNENPPRIPDRMVYSTGAMWYPALRLMSFQPGERGIADAYKLHPAQLVDALIEAVETTGGYSGAQACIRAAYLFYGTTLISPAQMDVMIKSYKDGYDDMSIPLQSYIDSVYSDGRGVHTFSTFELKEMEQKIMRAGEVWVHDADIDGVWVFAPPSS